MEALNYSWIEGWLWSLASANEVDANSAKAHSSASRGVLNQFDGWNSSDLREKFELIVLLFQNPLLHFINRMVGDYDTAQDLTQETLVKAYQKLHQHNAQRSFKTWLFSIAANQTRDFLRANKKWKTKIALDEALYAESSENSSQQMTVQSEKENLLARALVALSAEFKEVIFLYYESSLSVNEISETLGISHSLVKTRLLRARDKLRLWMEAQP